MVKFALCSSLPSTVPSGWTSNSNHQSLLGTAKKLVAHFHHSVIASEELKRRCSQIELKEYKVIQMCPTQ